ncbi:hypothetical protein D3C71_1747350 [compost metagenome]
MREEKYKLIEIRNGMYTNLIKNYEDVEEILPIYNKNGVLLKINSKEQLLDYENELNRVRESFRVSKRYSIYSKMFLTFTKKWHKKSYSKENNIAELFSCFVQEKKIRSEFLDIKELVSLTNAISDFKQKHPIVFNRFLKKNNLTWG